MTVNGVVRLLAIASLIGLAQGKAARAETVSSELKLAAAGVMPTSATDAKGNIRVPANYRTTFQFLGSWSVAGADGKGVAQIHAVYASPGAIAGFREQGHFPDGTILVKEVFDASTAEMTTGTVSRAETLKGWFVMVRDTQNSHPDSRLWGDGWGWSWFDAPDPNKTTSTDYKTDCQGCHVPAQATDWIYVGGYPALKK
jgi:hypothetical protein